MGTLLHTFTTLWLPVSLLHLCVYSHGTSDAVKCCTPDQWQGSVYFDWAQVFIDGKSNQSAKETVPETLYTYYNASGMAAYDYTNNRTYLRLKGFELTPLVPGPEPFDTIILNDYKQNKQFQVSGGKCQKSSLDTTIIRQCIPDDAEEISAGFIEFNVLKVKTYRFRLGSLNANTLATVIPSTANTCIPMHVSFFLGDANPDSGTVYNMDLLDVAPYIMDPTIFKIPSPCL